MECSGCTRGGRQGHRDRLQVLDVRRERAWRERAAEDRRPDACPRADPGGLDLDARRPLHAARTGRVEVDVVAPAAVEREPPSRRPIAPVGAIVGQWVLDVPPGEVLGPSGHQPEHGLLHRVATARAGESREVLQRRPPGREWRAVLPAVRSRGAWLAARPPARWCRRGSRRRCGSREPCLAPSSVVPVGPATGTTGPAPRVPTYVVAAGDQATAAAAPSRIAPDGCAAGTGPAAIAAAASGSARCSCAVNVSVSEVAELVVGQLGHGVSLLGRGQAGRAGVASAREAFDRTVGSPQPSASAISRSGRSS